VSEAPPGGTGGDAPPPPGVPPEPARPFPPPAVPPGARCAVHVETAATNVCSRCGNFMCEACAGTGNLGALQSGAVLCPTCVDKAPSGIPWEQRKELGVFAALVRTWREVVLEPSTFFARRPTEKALWPVFLYGMVWRAIAALGSLAFQLPGLAEQRHQLENNPLPMLREWSWIATPAFQLASVALLPVTYVISAYVVAGLWWTALKMVGGMTKPFDRVLRSLLYADSVHVFGAVPYVGAFVSVLWSAVLQVIALHRTLETDLWRVIVAGVLLVTLTCALCTGAAVMVALAMAPALAGH